VLDYRDETVARLGLRLVVANVQDYIDDGRLRERRTAGTLQTVPLLDAAEADKFDAVFGGGRRDERRPGPRSASSACATRSAPGTRAAQRPSSGTSTTTPRAR
jgi:hypothetical protein